MSFLTLNFSTVSCLRLSLMHDHAFLRLFCHVFPAGFNLLFSQQVTLRTVKHGTVLNIHVFICSSQTSSDPMPFHLRHFRKGQIFVYPLVFKNFGGYGTGKPKVLPVIWPGGAASCLVSAQSSGDFATWFPVSK